MDGVLLQVKLKGFLVIVMIAWLCPIISATVITVKPRYFELSWFEVPNILKSGRIPLDLPLLFLIGHLLSAILNLIKLNILLFWTDPCFQTSTKNLQKKNLTNIFPVRTKHASSIKFLLSWLYFEFTDGTAYLIRKMGELQ